MNHQLTPEQQQQMSAEASRRYHLMLAQADSDLRALEEQIGVMTVAEYHVRKTAIEATRAMLKAEWEKAK